MFRSSRVLAGAAAVAALATAGLAQAFTDPVFHGTDPTIGSPGYPDFAALNYEASLTHSGSVYTLSITGSDPNVGIFNFQNAAYLVGNEQIKLTANFDSTGHLLNSPANTYEVDGSLAAWSNPTFGTKPAGFSWAAQPVEKLFSSALTAVTVDSTNEALGFKSTSFGGWANQKQFTGGGAPTESVWLFSILSGTNWSSGSSTANSSWDNFLAEIKNHAKGGLVAGNFYGVASIATVPVPAALWLFGSGLAGLGGMIRRRKAA